MFKELAHYPEKMVQSNKENGKQVHQELNHSIANKWWTEQSEVFLSALFKDTASVSVCDKCVSHTV